MERCPGGAEPCGVVLQGDRGRVVFEQPVLLPEEQFIPIDLIRGRNPRGGGSRVRWTRPF
ncbi:MULTISPECIES: hypothetical protein [Aphanothece]|uniref:hypothetical protein n=1 Tax=Aphanothece TaxID=1121 RepID=UPI003985433A